MTRLQHITINTGHSRWSDPDEVSPDALTTTAELLDRALAAGRAIPLAPSALSHYALEATVDGGALLATVSGPVGPHVPGRPHRGQTTPIVTIAVARRNRQARALWTMIWAMHDPAAPEVPRSTPWAAALLYLALDRHPHAQRWLGDFERCLAWAWIERRKDDDDR